MTEQAEYPIPDDLKELYESRAWWDGSLMVKFAEAHGIPTWIDNPDVAIRRNLIKRIAALTAKVAERDRVIERLRGALERYGKHLDGCAINVAWDVELQCNCGFDAAFAQHEQKDV